MIKQTQSGEMMASGGETGRSPVSSSSSASSVGLEALFPAVETEPAVGDGNPELTGLRERLQDWLSPYEPLVLWVQRLLVWDRPLHSIFAAVTLNTVFWLLSSTSLRPLFLFSLCLIGLMLLEKWKDRLPSINVQCPEASITERESVMVQPKLLSIAELSHHLAESYVTCNLYIQEMVQYKRSNHGKFCVLVCAGCSVLAIVGHYVPGIMISYIMLISVLLWPLVVYHELIQKMYTRLEPILMKLDYSMKGGTQHRKHDKKRAKKEVEEGDEAQAETESESEEELSCFSPTVDVKTTALAMAITDSELSDEEASILESGGFSVSRATTPQLPEDHVQQSVNSEPEESLSRDLPEFPSVEEFFTGHGLPRFLTPLSSHGQGTSMELHETEPQNPAGLSIQHLASPLHFVNTHFSGHGQSVRASQNEAVKTISQGSSQSLEALSEEIVSTAISSVLQNTLSALLHSGEDSKAPSIAEFLPAEATATQSTLCETVLRDGNRAMATVDTKQSPIGPLLPTEEEDFELLDQSELEQMDNEMGLSSVGQGASDTEPIPPEHSHYSQQS